MTGPRAAGGRREAVGVGPAALHPSPLAPSATCAMCPRPLIGGWVERPGQPPICLSCASVVMTRELRAAEAGRR
jgi:hypothetical protein